MASVMNSGLFSDRLDGLLNPRTVLMDYKIREIIMMGKKLEAAGARITAWENIGDPIAKGFQMPEWIRGIAKKHIDDSRSWGYEMSEGNLQTREYIAERRSAMGGIRVSSDDVVFANGLGAAINLMYKMLGSLARGLFPSPTYPAHSSNAAYYHGEASLTYRLDPKNGWLPDLSEIEAIARDDYDVKFIVAINPGNPTGAVFPIETIDGLVRICADNGLILIMDEIYRNMVYNGHKHVDLGNVIGDRCLGISMQGSSKDIPWPGGRCGWLEKYNSHPTFDKYFEDIRQAIRLEVCATSQPQRIIRDIYSDARINDHFAKTNKELEWRGNTVSKMLNAVDGVSCNPANGAFYLVPVFDDGLLNDRQTLPVENPKVRAVLEDLTAAERNIAPDYRFALYLMASKGICVVPLSGFAYDGYGFRVTTLETDRKQLIETYTVLCDSISEYFASA